jgi:hypothetical protein
MKTAKSFLTLLFVSCAALAFGQSKADEATIKKKHLQYLTPRLDGRKAKMKIFFDDLNKDGLKDAFIDWCIEATDDDRDVGGGNALSFLQCMENGFSVYINTGGSFVLKADKDKDYFTDEGFAYDVDKVGNEKVYCSNMAYAEGDGRSWPTLKRSMYLKFENGKIVKPDQKVKVTKIKYNF